MPERFKIAEEGKRHEAVVTALIAAEKRAGEALAEVKTLSGKVDVLAANVSKLASARLLQQAFTSLVLAGGLTFLIRAFGG